MTSPSLDSLPEYDLIFAGGGTTACVTAGRLAVADPNLKILIIEQGPHSRDLQEHLAPAMFRHHLAPTSQTVTFHVAQGSDALSGRSVIVPSGRCVGGGSAVNFMMYTRAAASDYDDWEIVHGNPGWGSKDFIPLLNKAETYEGNGDPNAHGHSGPIKVSYGGVLLESGKQLLEVASAYDSKRRRAEDSNDFKTINSYAQWAKYIDPKSGRRSDAAHHYIYNQDLVNTNIHILANTAVVRVLIRNKVAVGVEYTDGPAPNGGLKQAFSSKAVIISGGAFGSPAILQRSGIGAKDLLEELGIPQEADLPGVGENYQDHNMALAPYFVSGDILTLDAFTHLSQEELQSHLDDWKRNGSGLVATNGLDVAMKLRPDAQELKEIGPNFAKVWQSLFENAADKPVTCIGLIDGYVGDDTNVPKRKYITPFAYTEYPISTGRLYITSAHDPSKPVHFESGYLTEPADLDILRWGYKKVRELIRRLPLYRGELPQAHPLFDPESDAVCKERSGPVAISDADIKYTAKDDEAINEFIRRKVQTTWHSLGTCAMKPRDRGGVVDSNLNVYGIRNLKVADLSICPSNVSANTYNTALGIGEKAAVIMAKELGIVL